MDQLIINAILLLGLKLGAAVQGLPESDPATGRAKAAQHCVQALTVPDLRAADPAPPPEWLHSSAQWVIRRTALAAVDDGAARVWIHDPVTGVAVVIIDPRGEQ